MNFESFIDYIEDGIIQIMGNGVEVKTHKILKNNNVELDAITILEKDNSISPTIYLNYFYEEFLEGKEIGEIVNEIYELYEEHSKKLNFDMDIFMDFDRVKERIAFKLINTKSNSKLLKDIPHIAFLDLSIVFYCLLDNDYLGTATALIHNVHRDMWKISTKDLFEIAKINTPRLLECEIKDMNDLIKEILVDDLQKTIFERDDRYDRNCINYEAEKVADGLMKNISKAKDQLAMYVLTNKQRTNGAVCILYDEILKKFAQKVDCDVYILPSSVHEVILVPATEGIDGKSLSGMVKEVNQKELDKIDILANHIYYYSKEKDEIMISDKIRNNN